jgi:DNA-binding CsgD family transcriptional regulator/tetratricopeptide (TPR) repeat protein
MVGQSTTSTFVGRAAELAQLSAALERAAHGAAAAVLIGGEAGVGKSRLIEELLEVARRDGALTLVGRCIDFADGELAYAPITGALRPLPDLLDEAVLDQALGAGRAELARLVPALAAPGDERPAEPAPYGRERLFEFLLGTIGRLGARRPVLLVIEDLHWADGSTRDLLRFLVRAASVERFALVITCRTDDFDRADPMRPYLLELRRDPRVACIDLKPFTRQELGEFVRAITGTPPNPTVLQRLHERSEGNAFFAQELLRAGDSDAVPVTVRDSLIDVMHRLSPAAARVVRVLAAAGPHVDHRLLELTADLRADDLSAGVREALDARIIVQSTDGRALDFRHALLREVAHVDLLPGERRELHGVLARALERFPDLGDAATLAGELAHHWSEAGDHPQALIASVRAAGQAERLFAHQEALRHLQRALELWTGASPETRSGVSQLELTERATNAACASGEAQLAIALARRAVDIVGPDRAARQHAMLARCLWDGGRGADALSVSVRAIALTPPDGTAERALMLESHARLLLLTGREEQARAPIDEALDIARELGRPDIEAALLVTRVIATGDHAEAAEAAGLEALAAARRDGDADTLMRAYINAAEALDHAGRVQDAIDLADEGIAEARRLGLERVMGIHLIGENAGRLVKLGRYEAAAAVIDQGRQRAPEGAAAVALHQAAALLAARRGDRDGAAAFADPSAQEAGSGQSSARGAAAMAEVALWDGHPERARQLVDKALELVDNAEYIWYSASLYSLGAWACADRALQLRAAGDDDAADQVHAAGARLLARLDNRLRDADVPEPAANRAQAAAELGRIADPPDPETWATTRERWERLRFPFHVAVCAWREAEAILLTGGDRGRAARLLSAAADQAERLGARPLADAVADLARRARIPLNGGAGERGGPPPAGLTRRELEVLGLLATGHTNREIGTALFISEKTASVHVSHIFAKLGATNRTEAATLAHRLGVTTPSG